MGLHFSKEEFSKRKQEVLKNMKEQNLNALLNQNMSKSIEINLIFSSNIIEAMKKTIIAKTFAFIIESKLGLKLINIITTNKRNKDWEINNTP